MDSFEENIDEIILARCKETSLLCRALEVLEIAAYVPAFCGEPSRKVGMKRSALYTMAFSECY